MVTFVHGWKHNAAGDDANVQMFHHVLRELGTMEDMLSKKQHHPPMRVVGLYIGWHGLSADIEPFKELSFWDRKNTAEVVGHGAAIQLLSELEALRNRINRKFEGDIASQKRMPAKPHDHRPQFWRGHRVFCRISGVDGTNGGKQ